MIYRISYNQNMDPIAVRSYQPSTRKETMVINAPSLNRADTSIRMVKQFDAKRVSVNDAVEYSRVNNICPVSLMEQRIRKAATTSEDVFVVS